jgi:hypothetical protein
MKERIAKLKQIFWSNIDLMSTTTSTKDWQSASHDNYLISSELHYRCEKLIFEMYNKALK